MLLLLCSGIAGAAVWSVHYLLTAASDALAEMTAREGPAAPADGPKPPDEPKRPDAGPVIEPKEPTPPAVAGAEFRFIPGDFIAALVVQPERVLNAPAVKAALPPEVIAAIIAPTGVDTKTVERVTVLIHPFPGGNVAFFPGGVLQFRQDVDGKAVLGRILKDHTEANVSGRSYLRSKSEKMAEAPLCGHVADNRTLLLAPEPTLQKMLAAATPAAGPLHESMKKLDARADVAAAFVITPVRGAAIQAIEENKLKEALPPQVADATQLPDHVKGGTLALSLTGDTLLTVNLEAVDDSAGAAVEGLARKALDLGRQMYPNLRRDMTTGLPPDLAKSVPEMADQLVNGISVSRSGAQVTLTVKAPAGLAELAGKVVPMLLAGAGPEPGAAPGESGPTKPFVSAAHNFRITFPTAPKEESRKDSPNVTHTFTAQRDGGQIVYAVMVSSLPADLSAAAGIILDGALEGFGAKNVKSRRDVKLGAHRGVEAVIVMENRGVPVETSLRAYVVRDRLFQLQVTYLPSKKETAAPEKFFESFALLGPDAGAPPKPAPPVGAPPLPMPPAPPPAPAPPPVPEPAPGLPVKPLTPPSPSEEAFKGDTKPVIDLKVTEVAVPGATLGCLAWADAKGTAFYMADGQGTIRRVRYPDYRAEWKLDLKEKLSHISLSSEGLLLTLPEQQEVWLIDPEKGVMKQRFAIPRLLRAVTAPASAIGVAINDRELYILDLKKGTSLPYTVNERHVGFGGPVMTPDGKYLLTSGDFQILCRFRIDGTKLHYEQRGNDGAQGRIDTGITISPDSQFVCYPSFAGTSGAKNGVQVFRVTDLLKTEYVLSPGGTAVGFDPVGGTAVAQSLRLHDDRGRLLKEYQVGKPRVAPGGVKQILAHPAGNVYLLLMEEALFHVEVPPRK